MKTTKALGILLALVLIIGMMPFFASAQTLFDPEQPSAASTGTESITVTKYAADGTTILDQVTLTYAQMEATLPVQGDGDTLYYFQGPTFLPENLWDPDETVNLKNKGAIKGTDVKDLVELVGGAVDGDQIQIKARDAYNERFLYDNVYNPEPGQGKLVIAWYTKNAGDGTPLYPDGAYVPQFEAGMQLIFLVETTNDVGQHVFGHDDMRTYLPESNWHFWYDGTVNFPSSNGLSLKWISEVNVYSQAPAAWSIDVTGAITTTVGQSWFENALACHEIAEWTDGSGNVWSGLPLWWLLGLADDDNIHGIGSFNDALANAGYDIEVRSIDNYTQSFRSEDVTRSSDYIVANKFNGNPLPEQHYPLRLVGSGLTSGSQRVSKIASINLFNIPQIETWTLELSGADDYTMTQAEFESGVLCPANNHSATFEDASGTWRGMPLWLLVGYVDDDNRHGPGSFNDELAALGYQVKVIASDGYSYTFHIADVARNNNIIVANTLNGDPLPAERYPLRLVGSSLVSGGQRVNKISRIELLNLPTLVPDWSLELSGAISMTVPAEDFLAAAAANPASWEDGSGNTYSGLALWRLAGMVDDRNPATFNDLLAAMGYNIKVTASDGFNRTFASGLIARNDEIIIAHLLNDQPLPEEQYPLRLVGTGLSSGQMVRKVAKIELLDLPELKGVFFPLILK